MMHNCPHTRGQVMTKTFTNGQKVTDVRGRVWTVLEQIGNVVFMYENQAALHATKVWAA